MNRLRTSNINNIKTTTISENHNINNNYEKTEIITKGKIMACQRQRKITGPDDIYAETLNVMVENDW